MDEKKEDTDFSEDKFKVNYRNFAVLSAVPQMMLYKKYREKLEDLYFDYICDKNKGVCDV